MVKIHVYSIKLQICTNTESVDIRSLYWINTAVSSFRNKCVFAYGSPRNAAGRLNAVSTIKCSEAILFGHNFIGQRASKTFKA